MSYLMTLADGPNGQKRPKLAIVGHGHAGKDTVGLWFGANTTMQYNHISTSKVMAPIVGPKLGMCPEEAYARRRDYRAQWKQICDDFRRPDQTIIARMCLEKCDFVIGLRAIDELRAVQAARLVDATIWIDNNRVPVDGTVEFTKEDCDFVILNNGSLAQLFERLRNIAHMLNILRIN